MVNKHTCRYPPDSVGGGGGGIKSIWYNSLQKLDVSTAFLTEMKQKIKKSSHRQRKQMQLGYCSLSSFTAKSFQEIIHQYLLHHRCLKWFWCMSREE